MVLTGALRRADDPGMNGVAKMFYREVLDLHAPVDDPRGDRSSERSRRKKVRQLLTRRPTRG
jgi:hypothetical protein